MFFKNKFLKIIGCIILVFSVMSSFLLVEAYGYAEYESGQQYYSYEYNAYEELTTAPDGYAPVSAVYIADTGIDITDASFVDFFYKDEELYLLDKQGRIVILNKEYKLKNVINDSDIKGNEEIQEIDFSGALGLYVEDDGTILVCDTERERILFIKENNLVDIITRPDTTALSQDIKFDVKNVVKSGENYYVTAESVISGALVFNNEKEFVRFFGSNDVAVTSEVLLRTIQRLWMSDAQIAASRKFSASKISSLDVDKYGFIVVTSNDYELTMNGSAVRCINFKGGDITGTNDKFGDREITSSNANQFIDISVDNENFYVLLDQAYGRIFVYSDKGDMVTAFGGIGKSTGLFATPVAIETVGNRILVLDSTLNCFTEFKMTDYCRTKRELMSVIDSGNYELMGTLSNSLLKYNTNCQYAFYSKGFIEEASGNYAKAMEYYKIANETDSYSQAYKLYRKEAIKENFLIILIGIILAIAGIIIGLLYLKKGLTKKEGMVYAPLENSKKGFPLYCLFHPADGFSQIKIRKLLSPIWAIGILAVWFYIVVLSYFATGYIFNPNRASDFNILITFAKTFGILVLFIISNWAICTLMDGKGKPIEIFYTIVYSMIPYVLSLILTLPLSRFLTGDEAVFISLITAVGTIWSLFVGFVGLLTIHEYSVGKCVFAIILTLLGIAVIILLIVMFFTLIGQTFSFGQSIIQEFSLRN